MLRSEAIELVKQGLGFRTGTAIDTAVVNSMKLVQTTLEHEAMLPWFLVSDLLSSETKVGDGRVSLPKGFLREVEHGALWITESVGTDPQELPKKEFDWIHKKYGTTPGFPRYYSILGKFFRLGPVPDAKYPLTIICYLADELLNEEKENLWLLHAPDLLVARTGLKVAGDTVNRIARQRFEEEVIIANARLLVENEARMHANRHYVVRGNG